MSSNPDTPLGRVSKTLHADAGISQAVAMLSMPVDLRAHVIMRTDAEDGNSAIYRYCGQAECRQVNAYSMPSPGNDGRSSEMSPASRGTAFTVRRHIAAASSN